MPSAIGCLHGASLTQLGTSITENTTNSIQLTELYNKRCNVNHATYKHTRSNFRMTKIMKQNSRNHTKQMTIRRRKPD